MTRDAIRDMLNRFSSQTIVAALADILAGDSSVEGTLEGFKECIAIWENKRPSN